MNSPNVNCLFSCFAESPPSGVSGHTLNAFIFSLKNSEGLPPFKCFAKAKNGAIYKSSFNGPTFGKRQFTGITILFRESRNRVEALARIYDPYSVPTEVNNKHTALVGIQNSFSPDNCEVFSLVYLSKRPSTRITNQHPAKKQNPRIYILLNYR